MKTFTSTEKEKYSVLKDKKLSEQIDDKGWTKINAISDEQLIEFSTLFKENHHIKDEGMFYSLYSKDIAYRKRIAERINEILKPSFKKYFQDYKLVYSIFIVKTSGNKQTEFFIHQDPTITDESIYSSLHFWIPLDDITKENGAVCLIEKSHQIASPFRSITTPPFYQGNEAVLKKYLKPIFMKKGEALLLNPRTIHNSMANLSDKVRVAVLVGVLPEKAPLITTFYDTQNQKNQIELYEFEKSHFLEGMDFFESCMCRPENGKLIAKFEEEVKPLEKEVLLKKFKDLGINPINYFSEEMSPECNMFGEPI
jgi:ectoine hydroxylase-related dioxygenase (phytanoyl-CoA dioxygenase family)